MPRIVPRVFGQNVTRRSRRGRIPAPSWRFQLFDRQCRCLAVILRKLVDDVGRLGVLADTGEESWTFEEREDEEAEAPKKEGEPTEREEKVSPPHIVGPCAILGGGTREVGDQGPRDLYRVC